MTARRQTRLRAEPPEPSAPLVPSRSGRIVVAAALALLVLEGVAESLLWPRLLWGSHFYAFFPPAALIAAPLALLAIGLALLRPPPHVAAAERTALPHWVPWVAAAIAGALFWLARERHLFWGDALPLSINLPQGQRFHPDEPLTLYVHHLLYRVGGGRWSAASAVAAGSALAGALFAGWTVHWLGSRWSDRVVAWSATLVLLSQGFAQIFFGHVENYSYLAVCLLLFFTLGVDFLEGRRGPLPALLAAAIGFAFHILGALAFLPALFLVAVGWLRPGRRVATTVALAVALALLVAGATLATRAYGLDSPLGRLVDGVMRVLTNPTDTRAENLFAWRHAADVWSELMLLGPLSLPLLAALLVGSRGAATRTSPAIFLLGGALIGLAPVFVAGAGNLGAARNWDLFAAASVAVALSGVVWIGDRFETGAARGALIAIAAVSLFHTVPWVALNTDLDRTVARVAALPLGKGRAPAMLGTHYLNAGDLPNAERWFRTAAAESPENPNAASGLGVALARQRRLSEALDPMTRAVALKPESTQYRLDLIHLLIALERWEPAADQLEELLVLEPRDREAWRMLAQCRLRLGSPEAAVAVLEMALQRFPGDAEFQAALAELRATGR